MDNTALEYVGKKLYKTYQIKGYKRYLVFMVRCRLHNKYVNEILLFFDKNELRRKIFLNCPALVEQTTRSFFYKASTWDERVCLVKNHIMILENTFSEEFLQRIYIDNFPVEIWKDECLGKMLNMKLCFGAGQRKEGCLALVLSYEKEKLYQIMFWLNKDCDGETVLCIGALQGPQNGSEIIKELTKAFFGYRTKNLVFYAIRCVADVLGAKRIYAVSNEGYYAMNHLRRDRKLKTDYGEFWRECNGVISEDKRFYVIPVKETRKSVEEIQSKKRAQYRKRFAKLDEITESIEKALTKYR